MNRKGQLFLLSLFAVALELGSCAVLFAIRLKYVSNIGPEGGLIETAALLSVFSFLAMTLVLCLDQRRSKVIKTVNK